LFLHTPRNPVGIRSGYGCGAEPEVIHVIGNALRRIRNECERSASSGQCQDEVAGFHEWIRIEVLEKRCFAVNSKILIGLVFVVYGVFDLGSDRTNAKCMPDM
jgi:hypothetical protein